MDPQGKDTGLPRSPGERRPLGEDAEGQTGTASSEPRSPQGEKSFLAKLRSNPYYDSEFARSVGQVLREKEKPGLPEARQNFPEDHSR